MFDGISTKLFPKVGANPPQELENLLRVLSKDAELIFILKGHIKLQTYCLTEKHLIDFKIQ
jgi:hypothetical protein